MIQELENKIREALPRLKELTDGAVIYRPHWNIFDQQFEEEVFDSYEYRYGKVWEFDMIISEDASKWIQTDFDIIYHPIKLNDVLEYWKKKSNATTSTSFKKEMYKIVMDWDLSSVFLADQSEELKEFLNNL